MGNKKANGGVHTGSVSEKEMNETVALNDYISEVRSLRIMLEAVKKENIFYRERLKKIADIASGTSKQKAEDMRQLAEETLRGLN